MTARASTTTANTAPSTRATWQRLLRRLYLLAVGSVALAVGASIVVARSTPPPPSPGILRAALFQLSASLDDEHKRALEVNRLLADADLAIGVYDVNGKLAAANVSPAPRFRPPPHFHAPGGPPPDGPPRDGHRPDEGPDHGGPPDRDHGPPPFAPPFRDGVEPGFDPAFSIDLVSPSGVPYVVVVTVPGMGATTKLLLLVGAVLVLLALASVPFASTLSRPLGELARAASSFGAGDGAARADVDKAGAFSDLARTFNEMADRIRAKQKAERELLANVSHELRTPLARIRVALDLAAEGDAALAQESLKDIEQDLGELERLIGDVLTAARLDALDTTPLHTQPTALAGVIEDAAKRFRAAHPQHELATDTAALSSLAALELDPVLVRRAIDNFLDNAGKYSDDGSTVTLVAKVDEHVVSLTISDHGSGIAPADLDHLFTPFFRGEKSRAKTTGGVGLGLVLSKRIIEAHRGTVTLTSDVSTENHGTIVTLRLPRL